MVAKMRGIILAGGTGSRLMPLTKIVDKALLPVYNKPMVLYPLQTLIDAGITDILIVTSREHKGDIFEFLGSGKEWDIRLTYKLQDEPLGIAHALSLSEEFIGGDQIAVILVDNIFEDSFKVYVKEFIKQPSGAKIFLKEVKDPKRFGVVEVKGNRIVSIKEKPKKPKSKLVQTGFYMYDSSVFDIVRNLKPSRRGEYEISDVNNVYLKQGKLLFEILSGFWSDSGTFESLYKSSSLIKNKESKK